VICTELWFIAPFHNFSDEDITALYNCLMFSSKDEKNKYFSAVVYQDKMTCGLV